VLSQKEVLVHFFLPAVPLIFCMPLACLQHRFFKVAFNGTIKHQVVFTTPVCFIGIPVCYTGECIKGPVFKSSIVQKNYVNHPQEVI